MGCCSSSESPPPQNDVQPSPEIVDTPAPPPIAQQPPITYPTEQPPVMYPVQQPLPPMNNSPYAVQPPYNYAATNPYDIQPQVSYHNQPQLQQQSSGQTQMYPLHQFNPPYPVPLMNTGITQNDVQPSPETVDTPAPPPIAQQPPITYPTEQPPVVYPVQQPLPPMNNSPYAVQPPYNYAATNPYDIQPQVPYHNQPQLQQQSHGQTQMYPLHQFNPPYPVPLMNTGVMNQPIYPSTMYHHSQTAGMYPPVSVPPYIGFMNGQENAFSQNNNEIQTDNQRERY